MVQARLPSRGAVEAEQRQDMVACARLVSSSDRGPSRSRNKELWSNRSISRGVKAGRRVRVAHTAFQRTLPLPCRCSREL